MKAALAVDGTVFLSTGFFLSWDIGVVFLAIESRKLVSKRAASKPDLFKLAFPEKNKLGLLFTPTKVASTAFDPRRFSNPDGIAAQPFSSRELVTFSG